MVDYSHLSHAQQRELVLDKAAALLRRANRLDIEAHQAQSGADAAAEAERSAERDRKRRNQLAINQADCTERQVRADDILQKYNLSAPPPRGDESIYDYRRRLCAMAIARLPPDHEYYRLDISAVRGDDALTAFENLVYPEADRLAYHPSSVPRGHIVARDMTDHSVGGPRVTGFVGATSLIKQMGNPGRKVRISNPDTGTYTRR